ncbi:MAG: DUF397 domain-containing protein [Candidatus Scalindua rubra]|nr:DUF397 domain-containing protein [Candidatus Scalindua rubra]
MDIIIKGETFRKSSFSPTGRYCVGVSFGNTINIVNTKYPEKGTISFTKEEWNAFILGVKNSEFDIRIDNKT